MEIRLFQILGYIVCMHRKSRTDKRIFYCYIFLLFFAGNVCFNSLKSIAKSSKLLNIGKNWLKKGKSLQKSSALYPENQQSQATDHISSIKVKIQRNKPIGTV